MDLNWVIQEYLDSILKQKCIENVIMEDHF